ncbi:MAG TPA: bifunctional hydroxymethylpyrimidine kinase/phosphomethylpyrimidine kinase [Methanobacteriaceae archaeon]|nr:bifunctional hydroxymethylpyrimidine kinase/phosphomethylpyrimidine kinase [Methanobacteriaceae archaeon]
MNPPLALSVAGFDPSGGAGVLADVKTFHSLEVYGTAVITALTAQNVKRVAGVEEVSLDFVEKQLDLVMEEYPIHYAKTGMLHSPEMVKLVARKLEEYQLDVVVDPVMVAGSGGMLSQKGMSRALKKYLLPQAVLVTPNLQEAQELSGIRIMDEEDAIQAAKEIGRLVPVVVTGGHLHGHDIFYNGRVQIIKGELIKSSHTHGSGCTYSAAVTAYLSRGLALEEALPRAAKLVKEAIRKGCLGTLNQFFLADHRGTSK